VLFFGLRQPRGPPGDVIGLGVWFSCIGAHWGEARMKSDPIASHRGRRALISNLKRERKHAVRLLSAPRALTQVLPGDQSPCAADDPTRKLLCQSLAVVALSFIGTAEAADYGRPADPSAVDGSD
jgi:hypothetical protein